MAEEYVFPHQGLKFKFQVFIMHLYLEDPPIPLKPLPLRGRIWSYILLETAPFPINLWDPLKCQSTQS